jgi:hypothetical protein
MFLTRLNQQKTMSIKSISGKFCQGESSQVKQLTSLGPKPGAGMIFSVDAQSPLSHAGEFSPLALGRDNFTIIFQPE